MSRPIVLSVFSTAIALLCVSMQGCGSSSSGTGGQAPAPFAAPVDAASLSAALTTGAPGEQSEEFWECALSEGNSVFEYRFLSDGTGVETDQKNSGAQSSFTWQAISATGMVTTVTATGAQLTLTDIQFTGRDSIRLFLNENMSLTCSRMGGSSEPAAPVDVPAGSNALSYAGVVYPLTHGFEEAFSFSPEVRNDTHRAYEFQVADREFKLLQITTGLGSPLIIWRPDFARVWLRVDLHSPGGDGFQTATFQYESDDVNEKGPEVAGKFFFNKARFGIDLDGIDGIDNDTNEFIDVVAGTITVTRRPEAQATMSFDLVLEDGTTLAGSFSGLFPLYEYI